MILYSNVFLLLEFLKKIHLHEWKLYTEHTFVKKLNKLLEVSIKLLNFLNLIF